MTEMCAAVGSVQLKKLDGFIKRRRENAELLTERIKKIAGLTPPYVKNDFRHVLNQYAIKVEDDYPMNRNELAGYLTKRDVGVAVHYPIPIYKQPFYKTLGYGGVVCPTVEQVCKRILSLPVHPSVTNEDIACIVDFLQEVSGH